MGSQHSTTRSIAFFLRKQQNPEQNKLFTNPEPEYNSTNKPKISNIKFHLVLRNTAAEKETALNLSYNCSITGPGWNSLDLNSKISISEKQIHSTQYAGIP